MKTNILKLGVFLLGISMIVSCKPKENTSNNPKWVAFPYTLEINATELSNAPSLQSFAHGIEGDNWLLFAGRTNSIDGNGGLHNLNNDYAAGSFPPPSYNNNIYVYNHVKDSTSVISIDEMMNRMKAHFPNNYKAAKENESVFRNSNAQVKQLGEFLYVVGGYGPESVNAPSKKYITYNNVARIHIPSLINLVQGNYSAVVKKSLFAIGSDQQLAATGGELQAIGSTLYLVGGHNFSYNTPQKYQDAAYPFTVKDSSHFLTVSVQTPVTDVIDPTSPVADDISTMRRRDGPILPNIYKSPVITSGLQQGFAFYGGVFKPGSDSNLQAWNDAVYFHPSWANNDGKLFTQDKAYNQENYNVYSCPNFVVYDESNKTSNSFLIGGIGDGMFDTSGNLSGFTNTGVHIQTNIATLPLRSSNKILKKNLFAKKDKNEQPFYGAEAIFFPNEALSNVVVGKTKSSPGVTTEIFDMSKFGDGDVTVGYIFGGIEAFESNPTTYGPRKSRASNKIWKVILKKK